MSKEKTTSWSALAREYDMDYRTLKLNCAGIMDQIDACTKRKKYRSLIPTQVAIIKAHLG